MKREDVKIYILKDKKVFGSFTEENKYSNDRLLDVRDWIENLLKQVPEEHRARAEIDVDSIGGYEGEHHTEVSVYYWRPETDKEMAEREAELLKYAEEQRQRDLRTIAALKAKHSVS